MSRTPDKQTTSFQRYSTGKLEKEIREMRRSLLFAVGSGLVAITPAAAKEWPETAGWAIGEADRGCGMMMTYEGAGETTMFVLRTLDGGLALELTNYRWSIADRQQYEMTFLFDGQPLDASAVGTESNGKKGFLALLPASALNLLARSNSLVVRKGETLIDQLSLAGSGAASIVLERCLVNKQREMAERDAEEARLAHIPEDPFAELKAKGEASRVPARPRGDRGSWITQDDYPPLALREGRQGAVTVIFRVGTDGRVSNCRVDVSSGSPDLDDAVCVNIARRARFAPATDERGNPTTEDMRQTFTWRLPG